MPRFKHYSYDQGLMIPISLKQQIVPGTFEYALNHIIDNELDLSYFKRRYKNDETGAPAYDPKILLKIILYAYSRGITSSREIERCCHENIIFMSLSADTKPHFTTIADFIGSIEGEIVPLFQEVLLICDQQELIGKNMFAIDGCKISSNASKEWSGTRAEFKKKKEKFERAISYLVKKHRSQDKEENYEDREEKEQKCIENLKKGTRKIKEWLKENKDKIGKMKKPIKSNMTDNESAKMPSSHGVVQGYIGVAAVDDKHQVIVSAEAFGSAQEGDLLKPMVENIRENFKSIRHDGDVFDKAKLTADNGFYTNENVKMLNDEKIDGYVADNEFRKRDPRFKDAQQHKKGLTNWQSKRQGRKYFRPDDFKYDETGEKLICPNGKFLYVKVKNHITNKGDKGVTYASRVKDCRECLIRDKCMRSKKSKFRQVIKIYGKTDESLQSLTQKMKDKLDSATGRFIYSRRMGTVEPAFGNITHTLGLDFFSHRGKTKVNIQWLLYCIVHNIGKIFRYGLSPA